MAMYLQFLRLQEEHIPFFLLHLEQVQPLFNKYVFAHLNLQMQPSEVRELASSTQMLGLVEHFPSLPNKDKLSEELNRFLDIRKSWHALHFSSMALLGIRSLSPKHFCWLSGIE